MVLKLYRKKEETKADEQETESVLVPGTEEDEDLPF